MVMLSLRAAAATSSIWICIARAYLLVVPKGASPAMGDQGDDALVAPSTCADFLEQIDGVEVRMHNRVAATKPLDKFFSLVGAEDASNDYERLRSRQDDDDNEVGVIHVYALTTPRLFGLRIFIRIRIEDDDHLLGVDGSVEYRWKRDVSYPRGPLEEFLAAEAIPRLNITVWTVMTEVARTIGADVPSTAPIPVEAVITAVRHQLDEHPGAETGW